MENEINHELEEGMTLIDQNDGSELRVLEVDDDGSVRWEVIEAPGADGDPVRYNEWESHESIVTGLQHTEIATKDGKSVELVKNY